MFERYSRRFVKHTFRFVLDWVWTMRHVIKFIEKLIFRDAGRARVVLHARRIAYSEQRHPRSSLVSARVILYWAENFSYKAKFVRVGFLCAGGREPNARFQRRLPSEARRDLCVFYQHACIGARSRAHRKNEKGRGERMITEDSVFKIASKLKCIENAFTARNTAN